MKNSKEEKCPIVCHFFFGKKVTQLYPQHGTPNYSKHPNRDKEA